MAKRHSLAKLLRHALQSKACEQQEQIAELGRRVAELEVERADLASRNAMLQKLATIRSDSAAAAADTVRDWPASSAWCSPPALQGHG